MNLAQELLDVIEGGVPVVPDDIYKPMASWVKKNADIKFGSKKQKSFTFPASTKLYGNPIGKEFKLLLIMKTFAGGIAGNYSGNVIRLDYSSVKEMLITLKHELIHHLQFSHNIGKGKGVSKFDSKKKSKSDLKMLAWFSDPFEYKTYLSDNVEEFFNIWIPKWKDYTARPFTIKIQDAINIHKRKLFQGWFGAVESSTKNKFIKDFSIAVQKDKRSGSLVFKYSPPAERIDPKEVEKSLSSVKDRLQLTFQRSKDGRQLWIQSKDDERRKVKTKYGVAYRNNLSSIFGLLKKRFSTRLDVDTVVIKGKPTVRAIFDPITDSEIKKWIETQKIITLSARLTHNEGQEMNKAQELTLDMMTECWDHNEKYNPVSIDFKTLKKHQVKLSDEERAEVMSKKATWHQGPKGEPSTAVFKSVVKGKTYFTTHTHRAYNTTPTLDGTIQRYHDFIKDTA